MGDTAKSFADLRSQLIGFCYRMLGSVSDAEDIVHESYLRWVQAGRPDLQSPRSWYLKVCSRLCFDYLKSSQVQRQEYPGPWLPEPLVGNEPDRVELDETVSIALMLTMQRLKPAERAAFILHDVFGYEFSEVGSLLELQPAHCRQLAVRARRHLRGEKARSVADAQAVRRISDAFFQAVQQGDLQGLQRLLAEDVVLHSDGGGKAAAARVPIVGRERVTKFVTGVYRKAQAQSPLELCHVWFNGGPAVAFYAGQQLVSAYQLHVVDGQIISVFVHRNPDKLRWVA